MGKIDNHTVAIGNRSFVKDMAPISHEVERIMSRLEERRQDRPLFVCEQWNPKW
jgi:hypothetical protein